MSEIIRKALIENDRNPKENHLIKLHNDAKSKYLIYRFCDKYVLVEKKWYISIIRTTYELIFL